MKEYATIKAEKPAKARLRVFKATHGISYSDAIHDLLDLYEREKAEAGKQKQNKTGGAGS